MLQAYVARSGKLEPVSGDAVALTKAFWIDVHEPTPEEQQAVEHALDIRLRVPEEPAAFRVSTPLRTSDGYFTLTALLLAGLDEHRPQLVTVQLIKSKGPLVTVSKGGPGGLAWLLRGMRGQRSAASCRSIRGPSRHDPGAHHRPSGSVSATTSTGSIGHCFNIMRRARSGRACRHRRGGATASSSAS